MIFTRIRVWGELVKPWPMREKYPCVFFSLLYPTTFIEEMLLVVEAVNGFGSGVAGLSVLTHTHTLPTILASHPLTQTLLPLHELLNTQALQFSRPPGSCSPSRTSNCLLMVFIHRNFPGGTHAVFFPPRI